MPDPFHTLFSTAQSRTLPAAAPLFHVDQPVRTMFRVITGQIDLVRHSASGARMVLNRAGPGQIIAEASAYSTHYHCDGIAHCDTTLTALPVVDFRRALAENPHLSETWGKQLAHALQKARVQAEIRGLRTVSERLDAWLTSAALPPKGDWQSLAQTLGVTREALYRELARRRKDPVPR